MPLHFGFIYVGDIHTPKMCKILLEKLFSASHSVFTLWLFLNKTFNKIPSSLDMSNGSQAVPWRILCAPSYPDSSTKFILLVQNRLPLCWLQVITHLVLFAERRSFSSFPLCVPTLLSPVNYMFQKNIQIHPMPHLLQLATNSRDRSELWDVREEIPWSAESPFLLPVEDMFVVGWDFWSFFMGVFWWFCFHLVGWLILGVLCEWCLQRKAGLWCRIHSQGTMTKIEIPRSPHLPVPESVVKIIQSYSVLPLPNSKYCFHV